MHHNLFLPGPAMNAASPVSAPARHFELRFQSRLHEGRSLAFPCDAAGRVDMDTLSESARRDYLYARTVVGCEFSRPTVRLSDPD